MNAILERYGEMEGWMIALTLVDRVWFLLFFVAVLYLALFAFSSMFRGGRKYTPLRRQHRFLILFPLRNSSQGVEESMRSFVGQNYPMTHFDLALIGGDEERNMIEQFREAPVPLFFSVRAGASKSEAIRVALDSLPDKAYDIVVIMEAGHTVEATFLSQVNDAYAAGGMAIQTHRRARSMATDTALFEAASQEINNGIFRQGHVNLGLSSALAGSGMALSFDWLKQYIGTISEGDLEKQLEMMLLKHTIYIDYLHEVMVYEEKAQQPEEFSRKRGLWRAAHLESIRLAIRHFPSALFSGNLDFCNKLFQWLIPSRTILLGLLSITAMVLVFVSWPMSLKWWGLWFLLILTFSMALPDYLIDARFVRAVKTMPLLFFLTLLNLFGKKILKRNRLQNHRTP